METTETSTNLEKEKQPKYDVIVVFGRGIAKDIKGKWRPTRYIEELQEGQHSGIFPKTINPQAENAYIGGANANVLAAVQLFEEMERYGALPKLVIFAAGRPDYLSKKPPWISEGRVLEEKFKRKIRAFGKQVKTVILEQNKNTRDDIEESFKLVANQGFSKVAVITVGVHVPRSREFFELARKEDKVPAGISVDFLAAEEILARRDKRYTKIFELARKTKTYKRTVAREQGGVRKLRAGRYKLNSQGYRF